MSSAPISLTETLAVGSVEMFLTTEETEALTEMMNAHINDNAAGDRRKPYDGNRATSIHEIPGHTTDSVKAIYEPAGRVEITDIPTETEHLLQVAFQRARPAIARLVPAASACRPWTYVEYAPGQHITAHLDGIAPDPSGWPRQVAGISVALPGIHQGGEFFVETTSNDQLWNTDLVEPAPGYRRGMEFARDGADNSAGWFRAMPRTRWTVDPMPGAALLYGSQLAHGTLPVTLGRVRKFISWLIADDTSPDGSGR